MKNDGVNRDTGIEVGDLVKGKYSGKIGIVKAPCPRHVNYWYVVFHDETYTVHSSNIKPLEKL